MKEPNVFIGEKQLGWVAERFIAPVLKTGDVERRPWVRIPPHPLLILTTNVFIGFWLPSRVLAISMVTSFRS